MTKRALIVDDEPDIRELLEITLGRMDIETKAAKDVRTATELLATHQFDLCLTDMRPEAGRSGPAARTGRHGAQTIGPRCTIGDDHSSDGTIDGDAAAARSDQTPRSQSGTDLRQRRIRQR